MTRDEERAFAILRKHRGQLEAEALKMSTSFTTKEAQGPAMKIAEHFQMAADAIDLEMMRMETGRQITECERLRTRLAQRGIALGGGK